MSDDISASIENVTSDGGATEAIQAESDLKAALDEQGTEQIGESQVEESNEDINFAKKFAALSRKDKEIREKESSWNTEKESMLDKIRKFEEAEAEKNKQSEQLPLDARLRKDPMGTLAELGLDYETITQLALNDGKLTSDMQMKLMREEMQGDFDARLEGLDKKYEQQLLDRDQQQVDDRIEVFKDNLNGYISQNNEQFELINMFEASNDVYDVITEHYNETGNVLSNEEACKLVEDYYEDYAKKLISSKKFGNKNIEDTSNEVAKPDLKPQSPTLKNTHASQVSNNADGKKLSREDSIAAAASMIKWND